MALYEGALIVASSVTHPHGPFPARPTFNYSIYTLSASTGEKLWEMPTNSTVGSSPLVDSQGFLYIGDNTLFALKLEMGPLDSKGGSTGMEWMPTCTGRSLSPSASSAALANDGTLWVGSATEMFGLGGTT